MSTPDLAVPWWVFFPGDQNVPDPPSVLLQAQLISVLGQLPEVCNQAIVHLG